MTKLENLIIANQIRLIILLIKDLKLRNYLIIGPEITVTSIKISDLKIPKNSKIVFVIGDEKHGISASILEICEYVVHIEMYGQNSSMNVAQAASIALYEFTKKLTQ